MPLDGSGAHGLELEVEMLLKFLTGSLGALALAMTTVWPVAALGPDLVFDGAWAVNELGDEYWASVHQAGTTVAMVRMYLDGTWDYALGARSTPTGPTVQGQLHDVDASEIGSFSLGLTGPSSFAGQVTADSETFALAGTKAFAVGPDPLFSGAWHVLETPGGVGPPEYYMLAHESGGTVAFILLSLDGAWVYALGSRVGLGVSAQLFDVDGPDPIGTFSVTANAGILTGQRTYLGTTTSLTATRIF
jgi:hypothetical protein